MKPNELRIGNYVYFKHCDYDKNVPRQINYTCKPNLVGLERISVNRIEYNNIEPIPLTAELLLKFGSKPRFQNTEFIYNRFRIVFKESYGYWYVIDTDSLAYITKVEFVHEWQNFIFTLTGDELTLAE